MAAMTEEGTENDLLDYEEEETETTTEVNSSPTLVLIDHSQSWNVMLVFFNSR
jgi:hypothetical protein